MIKKYNFGIMCAGNIARKMAETVGKMTDELTPYAIAARDITRAKEMAEEFGFTKSYGSYEELVLDENVDLVYVASPHSHHYEHVKLCLNHNKNVLCEKAFTANAEQAKEIIALAKEKNLFLGEALWTRFMPWVTKLQELLEKGEVGEVQAVQCGFGQTLTHIERLQDPSLAGGALLDLGIYPLTFASLILGKDILKYVGEAAVTDRGVDARNSITLIFDTGKMAQLYSDMTAWMPNIGVVCGSQGHIIAHDFWMCQRFTVCVRGQEHYDINCPFDISGYEYEVRAALNAIGEKKLFCDEMPWNETIRLMEIMDGLRNMWGIRFPFE